MIVASPRYFLITRRMLFNSLLMFVFVFGAFIFYFVYSVFLYCFVDFFSFCA